MVHPRVCEYSDCFTIAIARVRRNFSSSHAKSCKFWLAYIKASNVDKRSQNCWLYYGFLSSVIDSHWHSLLLHRNLIFWWADSLDFVQATNGWRLLFVLRSIHSRRDSLSNKNETNCSLEKNRLNYVKIWIWRCH